MPPIKRPVKMTLMLSEEEAAFRDELARQLGSDASAVTRQGMLDLGRRNGLTLPLAKASQEGVADEAPVGRSAVHAPARKAARARRRRS
jgi:hypothetical protein